MPVLNLLIAWLLLPFLAAFSSALLPRMGRGLALVCALTTVAWGFWARVPEHELLFELIGNLGVQLQLDTVAAPFLLLNGVVVLAVLVDGWRSPPPPGPFLLLVMVLLGGLNSAFLATDLVSLYVALEVVGIAAFLLILQRREPSQLWIALRYLVVSGGVMTLFLIGAGLVYLHTGSFRLQPLQSLPAGDPALAVAMGLVMLGLLTKAGVFLSGLWLPQTHAEAPAQVSALLSGVVVAGGLCPLLRLALLLPSLQPVFTWVGVASALLGVVYALGDGDLKRLLAWSTLSQMGFALLNPAAGGFYALGHGLAKAALFLAAGRVPTRDLARWGQQPLAPALGLVVLVGSLSIAGAPPLLGYVTKSALEELPITGLPGLTAPLTVWVLALLMVGTAAVYARLCWLPMGGGAGVPAPGALLLTLLLVLLGLLWPGGLPALSPAGAGKALAVLAAGAGVEALRRAFCQLAPGVHLRLPDLERMVDLLGALGMVGVALQLALLRLEPLSAELAVREVAWLG
ncbi:MAG: proton-conducting transporter membrane subunit [Cyanobacteria bacterium J06638_7]